jgi:hypothetical protein
MRSSCSGLRLLRPHNRPPHPPRMLGRSSNELHVSAFVEMSFPLCSADFGAKHRAGWAYPSVYAGSNSTPWSCRSTQPLVPGITRTRTPRTSAPVRARLSLWLCVAKCSAFKRSHTSWAMTASKAGVPAAARAAMRARTRFAELFIRSISPERAAAPKISTFNEYSMSPESVTVEVPDLRRHPLVRSSGDFREGAHRNRPSRRRSTASGLH